MAILEERYENHPVHESLENLVAAVDKTAEENLEGENLDYLDHVSQATQYIASQLSLASPVLSGITRLNNIQKGVQAALNELNHYHSNRNTGHITNASNQIDAAAQNARLLIKINETGSSEATETAISFKRLAENAIDKVRGKSESLAEDISEINQSLSNSNQSMETLKDTLKSLKIEVDAKLSEIESESTANETKRESVFKENEEAREKVAEDSLSSIHQNANEIISSLEEKRKEAERIVQLVGNIGLTGNYRGISERERKSANFLRWVALGSLGAMVLVIGGTLLLATKNGIDPWLTAFRFSAGLVLLIPATYAAKESSRHRANEERNKRTELELASIDAYLENLPNESKNEIKASLSKEFFGRASDGSEHVGDDRPDQQLLALLKDAISALGKK